MNDILNNSKIKYEKFLKVLKKRILEKEFKEKFLEVQKIDSKHFNKKISVQDLEKFISEYEEKILKESNFKSFQTILPGNPEIVFKLCLETMRYDVNMKICIEDFCLAQNTFLIEVINEVFKDLKYKNNIKLLNYAKDQEIIENSKIVDRTICIGNSNLYNRLENEVENFIFYPYGIFEIYSDSNEFEELEKTIYDYLTLNQFESEIYDDLSFQDAIRIINKEGYRFCTLLLSKDKEKMNAFKNNIKSEYVILNKNPFMEIKFSLEIL